MHTSPQEQDQMSPTFYSSIAPSYSTFFAHDPGLHTYLQRLLTHIPPKSRILDIGCGTGNPVASTLAAAGHRITGIDISDEMVRLSRLAVPGGVFKVADMRTYEGVGKGFEVVVAILSLFPLGREDIEMQVARWSSFLPLNGILGICTVAAEDVDVESKGGKYDADGLCARGIVVRFMGADVKITLFTRKGWEELLKGCGFEVVESMTEGFVPPVGADSEEERHWFSVTRKVGEGG